MWARSGLEKRVAVQEVLGGSVVFVFCLHGVSFAAVEFISDMTMPPRPDQEITTVQELSFVVVKCMTA